MLSIACGVVRNSASIKAGSDINLGSVVAFKASGVGSGFRQM